jgi:uncharacterized protein (UPF0333 family)
MLNNKNQFEMKNKFLFLAILLVSVSSLFAVPAVLWAIEKEQSDGTKISVFLKGDEKIGRITNQMN